MKKITVHYYAHDDRGKSLDISVEGESSYEVYYELEDLLKRDLLQWAKLSESVPKDEPPEPPVPEPPSPEVAVPTSVDRDKDRDEAF